MDAVIGAVIGFLLGIPVVKAFVDKARVPVEEVGELLVIVAEAVKDGKITPEELKKIREEGQDVLEIIGQYIGNRKQPDK